MCYYRPDVWERGDDPVSTVALAKIVTQTPNKQGQFFTNISIQTAFMTAIV